MKRLHAMLLVLMSTTGFAQVTSFNTRTGSVTLNRNDVATALGYTPATQLTRPRYLPPTYSGSQTGSTYVSGYFNVPAHSTGNNLTLPGVFTSNVSNGNYYASRYQTGGGDNGIDNLFNSPSLSKGGVVIADPFYGSSDHIGTKMPNLSQLLDYRQGYFHTTSFNAGPDPALGGNQEFFGISHICTQTLLPSDNPPVVFASSGCTNVKFTNLYPGWNYGSPGTLSDSAWFVSALMNLSITDYSVGIHSGIGLNASYTGAGDENFLDITLNTRGGWIAGSDEGVHLSREVLLESPSYVGTVSTGGEGATVLSLACSSNCLNLGINSPLLDETTGVRAGTVLSISEAGVSGLAKATTSFTVPVSATGTLRENVDVPRARATNYQLPSTSRTFTVNTTTPLTKGQLIDIIGPAFN